MRVKGRNHTYLSYMGALLRWHMCCTGSHILLKPEEVNIRYLIIKCDVLHGPSFSLQQFNFSRLNM
jgi:hypothetical protein